MALARPTRNRIPLQVRRKIAPYQSGQRGVESVHFLFLGDLPATLTFTGPTNLTAFTSKGITGVLSFTGPTKLLNAIAKGITGGLSFTGSLPKRILTSLTGAVLSFTGATTKKVLPALAATLSFSGSQARRVSTGLSGTLSFTGAILRRTAHLMTATLSFSGLVARFLVKALAGVLSFTGTQSRSALKSLVASLDFIGISIFVKPPKALLNFVASVTATSRISNLHWYYGTFQRISKATLRATSRAISNFLTQKQDD